MALYRNRETGEVKTQKTWKAEFAHVSTPSVWNESVLDGLGLDPVLETPKPDAGVYQRVVSNGVEQDAQGNWVEAWQVVDRFSDTDDQTKAEQEAAYQLILDEQAAQSNREKRNKLLAETDFHALSDVTISDEMRSYRQSLRDITAHENWPNLNSDDWPVKP